MKIVIISLILAQVFSHTCLNEKGQRVDWFISLRWNGYKQPRKYLIMDSSDKNWRWTSEEALIKPLFQNLNANSERVYAWNDQPPIAYEPSTSYAHSKGLITYSAESNEGFFLSHSIPKFPEINKDTGEINYISNLSSSYGQQVACIALNSRIVDIQKLLDQISATKPYVYHNTLTPSSGGNSLKSAQLRQQITPLELNLGGFTYVTKPKSLAVEVYEEFLVPFWNQKIGNSGFYVETWGRPILPSVCQGKPVINIEFLSYDGETQKRTQDHSKWALSLDSGKQLLCVGDLNHQESQDKRGGSFLCLRDQVAYNNFRMLISEHDCTAFETKISLF